jgi:cathepsin L
MESVRAINEGSLVSLSEQQLVDCSGSYGNYGCNGGWPASAFQYNEKYGNEGESDYPYKAKDQTCSYNSSKVKTKTKSYVSVTPRSTSQLMSALNVTPTTILVQADQYNFQYYKGGVLSSGCGTQWDHAVLATGYGTDSKTGQDYWLVKNSWGTSWGEDGYVRILRTNDASQVCGVTEMPIYPTY